MSRTLQGIRRWSDMPIAIQLNHAGRKASTEVPWKGGVNSRIVGNSDVATAMSWSRA